MAAIAVTDTQQGSKDVYMFHFNHPYEQTRCSMLLWNIMIQKSDQIPVFAGQGQFKGERYAARLGGCLISIIPMSGLAATSCWNIRSPNQNTC